jgi:hypothetical protein
VVTAANDAAGADAGGHEMQATPDKAAHFCYADGGEYECDQLLQGDVLKRTPEIEQILSDIHPHFHRHNKNLFFMVLSQSCDLVRRNDQQPNALYVNVAPVRPIDEVLSREIAALQLANVRGEIPLVTQKAKVKLADFARRLLNNNVAQYFYLEGSATPLGQDCCAFLRLSIPIKTELHYQACLDAKILQLTDAFQAKLGSLVGQLYSRVGTKDWKHDAMEAKVKGMLNGVAHWVDDEKVKHLQSEFANRTAGNGAHVLSVTEITAILKTAPNAKTIVTEKVLEIAATSFGLNEAARIKFLGRLKADPTLNKMLGR